MKPLILFSLIASTFSQNINQAPNINDSIDTTGTIYHDLSKEEADQYYSNIEEGSKGDNLLSSLQSTLKFKQKKLNYNSGDSTSSDWHGYYLYERNYNLSPLEESELNGNYKTSGIRINSLYSTSPIYIETGINKKDTKYKYYDENNEIKEGTFGSKGGQFDREHVFPKSFGFNYKNDSNGYKKLTAGCDAHNLNIGEHAGNSTGHNNLPYGNVVTKDETTEIRSTLNNEIVGHKGVNKDGLEVFEPLDKDKGNIARTIFYMAARYHAYEELSLTDKTPALALGDKVTPVSTMSPEETKEKPGTYGQLSDLLEWNILDPVDEYEIHRNNLIYNAVQFNRNPFVDYPSWAEACFAPDTSKGISFDDFQSIDNTSSPLPGAKYELTLKTNDNFKKKYDCFSKFDPAGFEIELLKDGEKIEAPSFTLYSGDQILTDSYLILGIGEMEIKAQVRIDNKIIYSSNTITITLELSKTQIIIIGVALGVLLLLIIWFIVWAKKKKNRKKVKYLENKVEKAYKKSKKKNK